MLNENNERELAYVVTIGEIEPIEGYDRVELAHVLGWTVMVRKGQFKPGDLGIYIEIDSLVPQTEIFEFMRKYEFKVKTQRFCKGKVYSQGLLMHPEDFGWTVDTWPDGENYIEADDESFGVGAAMTKKLGITYYSISDRKRKSNSPDKYKLMAQRKLKLFRKQPFRWLMRRDWGKKLLFVFFGKKKDKRSGWPYWVAKTDESRIQDNPNLLKNKMPFFVTEKIDGTSTTFSIKRTMRFFKVGYDFYVCSRNVVMDKPEKECYYTSNVYWEMALKYGIEDKLNLMLSESPALDFVTLQGETFGKGIQARDYHSPVDFRAFNLIYGYKNGARIRFNPVAMKEKLDEYDIPSVPILAVDYILPDTVSELLDYAASMSSVIDDDMREGVVLRNADTSISFKAVSNEYLVKYHNRNEEFLMNIDNNEGEEEEDVKEGAIL